MSEMTTSYYDLRDEDMWIEYLRTRLPYSFNRVDVRGRGRSRHFVLSEPELYSGPFAAERHNYWRRGNIFYMSGKLLDFHSISDVSWQYRLQEVIRLLTDSPGTAYFWPTSTRTFHNSMQLEKVWGFAQDNVLDRERVMLSNIALSIELCLKAIAAHASFRVTNRFEFKPGHDIANLYGDLPAPLLYEIKAESRVFARDYLTFRKQVEADIQTVEARRFSPPQAYPDRKQRAEAEWNQMAKRTRESNYTAFVNSNDPGATEELLHEDWFEEALNHTMQIEGFGDIIEYLRYAPLGDTDELPTPLINGVLLLGRFMYEHLFPVPPSDNDGPMSGFPIRV